MKKSDLYAFGMLIAFIVTVLIMIVVTIDGLAPTVFAFCAVMTGTIGGCLAFIFSGSESESIEKEGNSSGEPSPVADPISP